MLSFSRSYIALLDLTRNEKGFEIVLDGNKATGRVIEIFQIVDIVSENKVRKSGIKG